MPVKLTTTTEGGKGEKKIQKIYRTSQNIRIINVFLESLLPALDLLWGQLRI